MNANANAAEEANGIEKRTKKAAVESMSLDRYAGNTGEYDVYSQSGSVYRVCLITESCSCPDEEHNSPAGGCKHFRRVEMETGQREVPDLDQQTDVDLMIDARADQSPAETDQPEAMTDGGVAVETGQTPADVRPADCSCLPSMEDDDLGCFPCYLAGFDTANPNATEEDDK